jgi:hypothetical protein
LLYACALLAGFVTLLASIAALILAARGTMELHVRLWLGRIARAAAFFTLANYGFNGLSDVTRFLAEVSVIAMILWAIAVFIDARVRKATEHGRLEDKNKDQYLY